MQTIDERVVEMRFDNRQFESNAQESIGTIEKLKKTLDFSSSTKSFDDIEQAANKVDFGGFGNAIEAVKVKFSALEVMAITALQNITNKIVDTGVNLVKSLSVDQIMGGFNEYELKMGSIQTIMASTGESLDTVNKYLEELNTYSDKTIYSFSDMTSNIGKFTNAGVKLDSAVKAIQGVSNVAAVSGANANEASRAMYNFAQALSSGAVKLIDWKSIENANMATVEFKQQLLDTALAIGTVVKEGGKYRSTTTDNTGKVSDLFDATSNFNDALKTQWMTTDVLVQTLSNYSTDIREMSDAEKKEYETKLRSVGYTEEQIKSIEELGQKAFDAAQDVKTFSQLMDTLKESVGSGWAMTFEILIGNFEEAKSLWTIVNEEIGDILQKQSDARNELLKTWKELGGREDLMKTFGNVWKAILAVIEPIKEAFKDIFPPLTAKNLADFTKKLESLSKKLIISDEMSDKLKRTFSGLFSIVDILRMVFTSLFKIIAPGTSIIGFLIDKVLTITAAIGDWLTGVDEFIKKNNIFVNAVSAIQKPIKISADKMKELYSVVKEWVSSHFASPDLSFITEFADLAEKRLSPITVIFEFLGSVINKIVQLFVKIGPVLGAAASFIGKALSAVGKKIKETFTNDGISGLIDLFNSGVIVSISLGINKIVKSLHSLGESLNIGDSLSKIKDAVLDTFGAVQSALKADVLKKIATAIVMLTASLVVLSLMDQDKLTISLGLMAGMFTELFASMAVFSKTAVNFKTSVVKFASIMVSMSVSVLILSSALAVIASLDKDKLLGAVGALTAVIAELVASMVLLSKSKTKLKTGATTMIALANSVLILANAVKTLGKMDPTSLATGLAGVGGILLELVAFMALMEKTKSIKTSQAIAITILSSSLLILQKSVAAFGGMDLQVVGKGLLSIAGSLISLALAMKLMPKGIGTAGAGIAILAGALLLLQKPIVIFGNMDLQIVGKGLLAIAGALVSVALGMKLIPKNSIAIGAGLLVVSAALTVLTNTLKSASEMSWEELARGLAAIAASLTILAVAMKVMTGTASGSASMLVMSAALLALIPVIKTLGSMNIIGVAIALGTLAGIFTVIGVAGALIKPVVPSILGLAGAMALLGVAVLGIGAGLAAFAAGLTAISVTGVAAASSLVALIEILIVGILDAISDSAESLGRVIKTLIDVLCDAIIEELPKLVDTLLKAIHEILKSLVEYAPEITEDVVQLIIKVLDALTKDIPDLVNSIFNFLETLFSAVIERLEKVNGEELLKSVLALSALSVLVVALASLTPMIPQAMIGVAGLAVIIAELTLVLAAIGGISEIPGIKDLVKNGGEMLQILGTAIGQFIGGIIGGMMSGVTSQFPKIGQDMSDFMTNIQPFIEGASKIDPKTMDGVKAMAEVILILTAANILDGLTSWFTGGTSIAGFGEEIAKFGPYFNKYYESIKGVNGDVVQASANAALSLAQMAEKLPKQGGVVGWFTGENSLSTFAEELTVFGPKLKAYAKSVEGIDEKVVKASANAALTLAEMAQKLPNQGGVVAWFTGDNSLSQFAEELAKFGPKLAEYAKSVKGISADDVISSANAAMALAELANNLPNSGGVVSWFVGNNDIDAFGEAIVIFGKSLKKYAAAVDGIDTNAITSSANAAKVLSELANSLPNTGGVASWFAGNKDMESFASGVEELGKALKAYSNAVYGIDANAITSSANAAQVLANLANTLPNQGGIASWFAGNKDMKTFGEQLKAFGQSMLSFYLAVSGIQATTLNSVIDGVGKLIDMAKKIDSVNSQSLSSFGTQMSNMAKNGITQFTDAFKNTQSEVNSAISTFSSQVINAVMDNKQKVYSEFYKVGSNIPSQLQSGIAGYKADLINLVSNLTTDILNKIKSTWSSQELTPIGSNMLRYVDTGLSNQKNSLYNSVTIIGNTVISRLKSSMPQESFTPIGQTIANGINNGIISANLSGISTFSNKVTNTIKDKLSYNTSYDIGKQVSKGLAEGITKNADMVIKAAKDVSAQAINASRTALGIHSPSKIFTGFGVNVTSAFANSIINTLGVVSNAGELMAENAIDPVSYALQHISKTIDEEGMDFNPTITPVMDLSNIINGTKQASSILDGLNASTSTRLANTAFSGFSSRSLSYRVNDNKVIEDKLDKMMGGFEGSKTENTNNFYIQSTDPKKAAEEVSYIMQHKVERGKAVWAK